MRLWSIHPCYLDSKGLVALWREALLAQKVLEGKTRGYTAHPQLLRFRQSNNPANMIGHYLSEIRAEAISRNYSFDINKIHSLGLYGKIKITDRQLLYEFLWLLDKLKTRDKIQYNTLKKISLTEIKCNPVFRKIKGEIAAWERPSAGIIRKIK